MFKLSSFTKVHLLNIIKFVYSYPDELTQLVTPQASVWEVTSSSLGRRGVSRARKKVQTQADSGSRWWAGRRLV